MSSKLGYRADIDGLRAVAVLAVVIHHFWPDLLTGGYVGVDVFFVISGFLITSIISKEVDESRFSFADFYDRRIRRIFPALFAMLAATFVAGWFWMLPSDYLATFQAGIGTLLFAANLVFWRQMADGYFAGTDASVNPLLHTWSLGVEEQFYIAFPMVLLLMARCGARGRVTLLVVAALASFGLAQYFLNDKPVAVFFLTPFRAWELLVGSLLAIGAVPRIKNPLLREFLAGVGLLLIILGAVVYDSQSPFPGALALLPVLGTAAVIHAGSHGVGKVARLLTLRPVVYVGLISYSLYLWHWPVLVLGQFALLLDVGPLERLLLLLVSILLAAASYQFIEKPFRSRSVSRRNVFRYASAASMTLFLAGLIGWGASGFQSRVSGDVRAYESARDPEVPFVECDQQAVPCRFGVTGKVPSAVFWGDSHMLAWAPGFDLAMGSLGKAGWLSVFSSCPPLVDVESVAGEACQANNDRVLAWLAKTHEVRLVVLAAYWPEYHKKISRFQTTRADPVGASLRETIDRIEGMGRTVVLMGPVPVYTSSVPLRLALERLNSAQTNLSDFTSYRAQNEYFYSSVSSQPSLIVADPGAWMCTPHCAQEQDGVPLYRDSHHLSVAGAETYKSELARVLKEGFLHGCSLSRTHSTSILGRNRCDVVAK